MIDVSLIRGYFSLEQQLLFLCFLGLLVGSIALFIGKKQTASVAALTLSALAFYSFVALLDPFLHIWDERFHALVAKNLMEHPLLPKLYENPVVDMAYDRWDRSIVWLHKQPLFLWQIMTSFKLFGVSEFALRLPSVIMTSFLIPMIFRVGKILVSPTTGFMASILMLSSFYIVQLVSGVQSTDHNDVAFLFYVTGSIWAWVEYENAAIGKKWFWTVLIGLIAGAAILCKWLVGLLVFAPFGLSVLMNWKTERFFQFASAFLVATIVALPWQILTFMWYPAEAALELKYNAIHFNTAVEGHAEELLYHIKNVPLLFGSWSDWLVLPAAVVLILRTIKRKVSTPFVITGFVVFGFYTLAETKMQSYPMIAALPVYVAIGSLLSALFEPLVKWNLISVRILAACALLVVFFIRIEPKQILVSHMSYYGYNEYHEELSKNAEFFKSLSEELPENSVLFNVSGRHYVEAMFYTDFPSYEMIPSAHELDQVENASMKSVILDDGRVEIPVEIRGDSRVSIIQHRIHSYH